MNAAQIFETELRSINSKIFTNSELRASKDKVKFSIENKID